MTHKLISREKCREIELSILEAVSELCKKNGIQYSLTYGTLIGAIRHKGFIPWDDDIDICLLRSEYEKLIYLLHSQTEYDWLSVEDSSCSGYYLPFAKAINNTTVAKLENNHTLHGVWIDIFPVDNIPFDEKKSNKYLKKVRMIRSIIIAMTTDYSELPIDKKYVEKRILYFFAGLIGKQRIAKYYERIIRKNEHKRTGYVGCLSSAYIRKERYPYEWFSNYIDIPFENKSFRAITRYDEFLSLLYGDYMVLPAMKDRQNHSIIAWEKE